MTDIEWFERDVEAGVVRREFQLRRGDRPVPGVLWQPERGGVDAPMVLFGHGASGDRHQMPIPRLARTLVAGAGFNALAIDGPVHGRRRMGDGARGAFAVEWRREGCVEDMVADWRTALDAMQALAAVGHGRIGYWGLSMGTIFGAPLVAAEPRIEVAVLGLMGVTGPTERFRQQIRSAALAIRCPVFFVMQLEDELFTREQYLELFDAFASTDKRLHANPGLHPQVPVEELDFSVEFLRGRLSGERRDASERRFAFDVSR